MLVLESRDADKDAAAFRAAGIGEGAPFHFEREGRRPDGSNVRVGFSLAFATDPQAPDAAFFVCRQHHPENFWNPAFQTHANTASGIAGVVLVAENPTDHHIFFSAFADERELSATSTGITVTTPRGTIQVMEPSAFRIRYGVEPPDVSAGARLAGLRFLVRDRVATGAALAAGGIKSAERMGRIVIDPTFAMGAMVVFESQ